MVEGTFVGYFDNSKAYKIWIPRTHSLLKVRDAIFDEANHIECVTIHNTDEDDPSTLWTDDLPVTIVTHGIPNSETESDEEEPPPHSETQPSESDRSRKKPTKIQAEKERNRAKK